MRLTDILSPGCVKVPLDAKTKQAAIFELVDLMAEQAGIGAPDELKKAVWQREQTRTTGIGHGIAIPHGKAAGCSELRMAVGVAPTPIEFEAIDRKPVSVILLLTSPIDETGPHIQALARISRMLTDDGLRSRVRESPDAETLYQLIADHEAQTAG